MDPEPHVMISCAILLKTLPISNTRAKLEIFKMTETPSGFPFYQNCHKKRQVRTKTILSVGRMYKRTFQKGLENRFTMLRKMPLIKMCS